MKTSKLQPDKYISIAGFKNQQEVKEVSYAIQNIDFGYHQIMYGIHCSSKRMRDIYTEGDLSPAVINMEALVASIPANRIPVIHYYSNDQKQAFSEISNLIENVPGFNHIQLNMDWPSVNGMNYLKNKFSDRNLKFILQLPERALSELNENQIARIVQAYEKSADYVLIDLSGGKGKELNIEKSAKMMNAILDNSSIPLSVAGGLSADNVASIIYSLKEKCGNMFSVDTQTRVRTEDNKKIAIDKATAFFKNSLEALTR
ncbi:MAG: hypothetical protein ACP5N1_01845 [Candidatus Woesearchaeota archaeon]